MNILSLDAANKTGYAWFDGKRIGYGAWDLPAMAAKDFSRTATRLTVLHAKIVELHGRTPFDLIVYEASGFGASNNPHTAAMHDRMRGVIEYTADTLGVPHAAVGITTIKKWATGNGHAKKPQMIQACETFFKITLAQDQDNEADSLLLLEFAKQHAAKLLAGDSVTMTDRPKKKRRGGKRRSDPQGQMF